MVVVGVLTVTCPTLAEPIAPLPAKGSFTPQLTNSPDTNKLTMHLAGKIGFLRTKNGAPRCTAFCLSTTLIATAGHCLRGGADKTHRHQSDLIFERVLDHQSAAQISHTTQSSALAGLVSGGIAVSFSKPIEADRDWALLRLQKPVCPKGGLKMASDAATPPRASNSPDLMTPRIIFTKHDIATLGTQPCQRTNIRSSSAAEKVNVDFSAPNLLIFHDCDAGPISSGSPLLRKTEAGFEVVAMHVGSYVRSRVLEYDRAIIQRVASKPVANIAVRVEEFTRPVKDLLRPVLLTTTALPGHELQPRSTWQKLESTLSR